MSTATLEPQSATAHFAGLSRARVEADPFPHLVLPDALPADVAAALLREMPPTDVLADGADPGSNKRFSMTGRRVLSDPRVSDLWKAVVREGMSQPFLDELVRLFGPHITAAYPDFADRFAPPARLRALRRGLDEARTRDGVAMDAQIAVNTPARTAGTTVRGPHLDHPLKLFVGLLYLRGGDDDSAGADLELYSAREPEPVFAPKRLLPREAVTVVRTIPYRHNTLVMFLNSPRALHGVTERAATPHHRYFINLVGEAPAELFSVPMSAPPAPGPTAPSPAAPSPAAPSPRPGLVGRMWNRLRRAFRKESN